MSAADHERKLPTKRIIAERDEKIERLRAENERLRAALKQIIDASETRDGVAAWDCVNIAHVALEGE